MYISDFVELTNKSSSKDQVLKVFLKKIGDFGFEKILYTNSKEKEIATFCNYSEEWIKHYTDNKYTEKDPSRLMCFRTRFAFTWDSIQKSDNFSKEKINIFHEARDFGLNDGVIIPLHGPFGVVSGIGLASSSGKTDVNEHLSTLYLLGVQFHNAYEALSQPPLTSTPIRLTPKEREIMQWCFAGKSRSVIADILNSSEKTVEWHLSRVYAKLGTSCRVTSVVKALHLGLIQP